MVLRVVVLLWMILGFRDVCAQAPATPEKMKAEILALRPEYTTAPLKSIRKLTTFKEHAKHQGWQEEELYVVGEIIDIYLLVNREKDAEKLVNSYLELAEEIQHGETLYTFKKAQLQIADISHNKERSQVMIEELLALDYIKRSPRYRAAAYLAVAQSYLNFSELKNSLEYLKQALDLFESIEDKRGITITQSSIAEIYQQLGNYEKSISYHKRALKVSEEIGDKFNISVVTFNIGNVYFRDEKFDKAKEYLTTALEMSKDFNDEVGIAYASRLLGELSRDSDPNLAYEYYREAERLFLKHRQDAMTFASRNALIELLGRQGRWEEGDELIKKQEENKSTIVTANNLMSFESTLFEYNKLRGNYKEATEAAGRFIELMKEKYLEEKEQAVQQLIIQYDSEKKEAENVLLKKNNELKELKLEEQKQQTTILVLSFCFVLTLVLLIGYLLYKQLKVQARFRQLALQDELTGAPNRRSILKYASHHYEKFTQGGESLSIAILDIDHFKQFNDQYGHDVGDRVLVAVAEACRQNIRKDDYFGRYGGEEWMLVLPNAKISDVEGVYERLSTYLKNVQIEGTPDDVPITFSMGVSCANDSGVGLESIIKDADDKMYQAKEQGRARMVA